MASPSLTSVRTVSLNTFLLIALWWGLLTGLGEGYLLNSYIWRDLMRAGVEIEPLLFLGLALLLIAFQRRRTLSHDELVRSTFLFSGLTLFACLSRSPFAYPSVIINLLITVACASLLAFAWFLRGPFLLRWQKRTLPILLGLALWCMIAFPIKQRIHERREIAKLTAASANAPNVLVIVVDTLRADHLSTYGYSRPTSPHLTQLAVQGTLFEDAIAPSSWTLPVHASLLTGLYPDAHHVDNDGALLGWDYPVLGDEFMARGYRTAAFSANTLLFCRRRGFGRGFIHFEDDFQSLGSTFAQTFYGDLIKHLLFRLELKRDLFGRRNAAQINQHALQWIDRGRQPFFLFLNYMDVHDPYRPPEPYLHRYTNMRHPGSHASEHWDWFEHLTPQQRQGAVDAYDGAINYVDDQLQQLMQQLQQRGLDRNTLVVITSDHGESFGEHGLMTHGSALYRELIHVPLIIWEPGKIPAGEKITAPVSLTSLPATLLEATGETRHPHFPEASLAGLWSSAGAEASAHNPISELAQLNWNPTFPDFYGPMESISTEHWHYIHGGKYGDELFPCCADQPEQLNLAGTIVGREVAGLFKSELAVRALGGHPGPAGLFAPAPDLRATYQLEFEPAQLALADFDNNGDVDILVGGRKKDEIALLLGDGKGGFRPAREIRGILASFIARRLAGAKLSLADCRGTSRRSSCALALAGNPVQAGSPSIPLQAQLTDVNGDGLQDVLLASAPGEKTAWLRADGHGGFYLMTGGADTVKKSRKLPISLARGDIDGNGLEDVAFVDQAQDAVVFLIATHPGVFLKATLPFTDHPAAIGLADLNHNGKADLVTINPKSKSVTVMTSQ
ncbi:MAG TPA: sulfatase-like hydrolase/transferase [Terriglobales bacterium]|nr:sulfatase-like hydrolase/transferase [Terriglobales bacterium]